MAPDELTLTIRRCEDCGHRFVPRYGPCPACGSARSVAEVVPGNGTVLAATELTAVAAGWTSPHRLALVELEGGARLLAIVEGELPQVGDQVAVAQRNDRWVVRTP
ncbi:MAG TPA: OB-fold domain-containing protein [Thermoplasmata archaeon]|nr:OB-fold domain-containing protein [Thermoplasmata archaeon]